MYNPALYNRTKTRSFRLATGPGIIALLVFCGVAHSAPQQPAAPATAAQSKDTAAPTLPTATKPASASAPAASSSPAAPAFSPVIANRKAWKTLTDGLAEKNYDRRAQAVAALGTIGLRRDSVALIEAALNDKDEPVRLAAADVLGTMKSRSSIPKLQVALDDSSPIVSFAAAQSLLLMGDKSGLDMFMQILDGDHKVSTGIVSGGMHKVHEELHDPTALAELGAIQTAGAFLGPAGFGVAAAIEMSKDKAAPARAISAKLLADDTSDDARQTLRDALQDKSWIVRAAAAEALGVHGSANDVAALAPLLDDVHKEVRYRAAAAIIRSYRPNPLRSQQPAARSGTVAATQTPAPAR
jgi:HEAT repeat protein